MNQGAQASGHWPADEVIATEPMVAPSADYDAVAEAELAPPSRWPALLVTIALVGAALAWTAGLAWQLALASPAGGLPPLKLAAWIGLGCGPLALCAILYVVLLRSGRAEANAYARASARLRADSEALMATLALVTERIEQARLGLNDQAGALRTLGAETGERMGQTAADLAAQADAFGRAATLFDDATARARADMGVLLTDLPRAEEVARDLAERLREGGANAETRARTVAELLVELETRGRAAGEASGGAAARLAQQLDRIEASAAAADRRIEDAAGSMGRAIDAALEAAAEGVEDTRRAVSTQSAALTALMEEGRSALGATGDQAVDALSRRLDELVARVDGIGSGLRGQELAARGLLQQLEQALSAVEAKFQALGDKGAEHTADLAEAIAILADHADAVGRTLGGSAQTADTLLGRVSQLRQHAEASSTAIVETIPAALARVRLHAEQSLQAIAGAGQRAEGLSGATTSITERLAEAEAILERQRTALDTMGGLAGDRLDALRAQAAELEALLARADAEVHALSEGATGQLVDALLRVRDTAAQASSHASDALSAAIPRAAQRLTEAASREMTAAIANVGREEIASIGAASEQAVEAARSAAERLSRHLLTIAETSTAIEARVEENREATEAHDDASFARSVSLLIEALNSTAIDVAKLFSNEVTDEQWKAYLRGDRGVFTRRAVRLLDRTEVGTIAARYGDDPEFREQVSRYIHDFEALLRRVMATREGNAIATTMLSSDAGKLYVALAQAIERLRR